MSEQHEGRVQKFLGYVCVTLIAFGIMGVYALLAFNLKVFSPIAKAIGDYSYEDFYYQILGNSEKKDTSNLVTIVDMTELNSRRDLANLLMEIESLHPKVMGVDIVFEGLKEDTIGDQMLVQTVKECNSAVYGFKLIDRTDESIHSFFMTDSLQEAFINMPRQLYGGLKRTLSIGRMHQGKLYPSFAKVVAEKYAGMEILPLADEKLRINFSPLHFNVVPYRDVILHRQLIEDRIVLVGAMKEENDMHYTPLGKIAGTELLAFGIETILKHNNVKTAPSWLVVIVSFLITLFVVYVRSKYLKFAGGRNPILKSVMSTALCIGLLVFVIVALVVWVSFMLFCEYNFSLNVGYGIVATAFIYAANNLYETIKGSIIKRKK
jgi:CHASE2 domain-containing sensor protein